MRGGMHAWVGDCRKPVLQLPVQILEIAEGAGQEEVLVDLAEPPLDFTLCLGPVKPASFRMEAKVTDQINERVVLEDAASVGFAGDHAFHAVFEYLMQHVGQSLERRHMTAEHGGQILMRHEAGPDQAAVAEYQ